MAQQQALFEDWNSGPLSNSGSTLSNSGGTSISNRYWIALHWISLSFAKNTRRDRRTAFASPLDLRFTA